MNTKQIEKLQELFEEGYTIFISNHFVDGPVSSIFENEVDTDYEIGTVGYSSEVMHFCPLS